MEEEIIEETPSETKEEEVEESEALEVSGVDELEMLIKATELWDMLLENKLSMEEFSKLREQMIPKVEVQPKKRRKKSSA